MSGSRIFKILYSSADRILIITKTILLTVVVFGEAGFEAEAGVTILHFCAGLL